MTQNIRSMLPDADKAPVANALQQVLVDLLDLGMLTKQAHWNLVGGGFRSLHLQLDEIVATLRLLSDEVAERMVTIGLPANGMSQMVAQSTGLEPLPSGWLRDEDVVVLFTERLHAVSHGLRGRIKLVAQHDPISEDVLIQATRALEKHAWMIQAQNG